MPLPSIQPYSPTVFQCGKLLVAQMELYSKPRGATVELLFNERHVWEKVFMAPENSNPRILICWMGDDARGEYTGGNRTRLHRVDRKWLIIVIRGHGFKNLLDQATTTVQGSTSVPTFENFYDVCETIRDGFRCCAGISEEYPNNYTGTKPLSALAPSQTANVFLDAFAISGTTANDIPAVLTTGQTE